MKPSRLGVIGVGIWGRNHARVLAGLADTELVGLYDPDEARAREIAREHGCRAFASLPDLVERTEAVVVAAPTTHHHSVTLDALAAGNHVLVEKPIAFTIKEADEMIAAAERADRMLAVGHLERFNPSIEALIETTSSPRFVEVHRLSPFSVRGLDVSVVLDLMIHDIDVLLRLVKSPVAEVRSVGVPVLSRAIDIANVRLRFENGCVANVTASRISLSKTRKIRVFEPDRYVSVNSQTQEIVAYRRTGPSPAPEELTAAAFGKLVERQNLSRPQEEPLQRELSRFLSAVRGEEKRIVPGEEGREALAVALRILDEMELREEIG